jgi:hypothetical protein
MNGQVIATIIAMAAANPRMIAIALTDFEYLD